MKDRDWNNFCMKKYGSSIRKKIFEAYLPFAKASILGKGTTEKQSSSEEKTPTIH